MKNLKFQKLFNELVPAEGKAYTVAGELVRATSRIVYRFYNDGDIVGEGYGKETCNPAARFLHAWTVLNPDLRTESLRSCAVKLYGLVENLSGMCNEEYGFFLENLVESVAETIETYPELKTKPNSVDFWDSATKDDRDDSWDEED